MDVVHAMAVHEIRKATGASDAGDGGDLLVPDFALLDQLEVEREDREVTAAGAPRRVIGGEGFFGEFVRSGCGGGGWCGEGGAHGDGSQRWFKECGSS